MDNKVITVIITTSRHFYKRGERYVVCAKKQFGCYSVVDSDEITLIDDRHAEPIDPHLKQVVEEERDTKALECSVVEFEKCKNSPYYFAKKYLRINGQPFTTNLTEEQFNNEFNKLKL